MARYDSMNVNIIQDDGEVGEVMTQMLRVNSKESTNKIEET